MYNLTTQTTKIMTLDAENFYRLVDFDEVLAMSNSKNKPKGEIAISILTPKQTIHAVPNDDSMEFHQYLGTPIYVSIFGFENIRPRACIEICHSAKTANRKLAMIYLPKFVTPREFADLAKIVETLVAQNVDVNSLLTDCDPLACEYPDKVKLVAEFEGDEILRYLQENGLVIDYVFPFDENLIKTKIDSDKHI